MLGPREAVKFNPVIRNNQFLLMPAFSAQRSRSHKPDLTPGHKRCDSSGMAKRIGIGASAATAVIFSLLLVSNLTVFMAAQDRQKLYIQAGAEDSLSSDSHVLAAVGAADILGRAQDSLEKNTYTCGNAIDSTTSLLANLAVIERKDGVTVVTSASSAPSVTTFDNMSAIKPFEGSIAGDVDISLKVRVSGAVPSSGVSIERNEIHQVHLPVHLEAAVSECVSGVETLKSALENSRPSNCTDEDISKILSKVSGTLSARAASAGFSFGVRYATFHSWGCFVYFDLRISQEGVEGPGGLFSVSVQQADFAYLRQFAPLLA